MEYWKRIVQQENNRRDLERHKFIQENEGLKYHIEQGINNQIDCTKPLPQFHKRKWKDSVIGISIGSISDIGNQLGSIGMFKISKRLDCRSTDFVEHDL